MQKKRKQLSSSDDNVNQDTVDCEFHPKSDSMCVIKAPPGIKATTIFILENASLHMAFVRKKKKILSFQEDGSYLLKQGKNPNNYRPDIFYEALRAILDSPLNKAGMVGAVYVKTDSGVVFEVNPLTRIPRTLKRFCGIMLELLEKSCIRAKDSGEVLLRVLKDPLMQHIPENAHIIGFSHSSNKLVDIEDYISVVNDDSDFVFVVGTMVHGKVSEDFTNDYISVSSYRLSAKWCVGLICEALEQKWNLLL
ncbi:unnamed protein product [Amaranthus hypochondriacus]